MSDTSPRVICGLVSTPLAVVRLDRDLPMPKDGWLTLPDKPGLGFEPNRDAIAEIAKLPLSSGRGKG